MEISDTLEKVLEEMNAAIPAMQYMIMAEMDSPDIKQTHLFLFIEKLKKGKNIDSRIKEKSNVIQFKKRT